MEKINWPVDVEVSLTFNGGDTINGAIDLAVVVSKKLDKSVSFEFNGKTINVHHWNDRESILKQYTN